MDRRPYFYFEVNGPVGSKFISLFTYIYVPIIKSNNHKLEFCQIILGRFSNGNPVDGGHTRIGRSGGNI